MKKCKDCGLEKELTEYYKNKHWYRGRCKKCHIAKFQPPIGLPNLGRFKKGNIPKAPFKKGNKPWNKNIKMPAEVVEKIACKLRGRKMKPEVYERHIEHLLKVALKRRTGVGRRSAKNVEWSLKVKERDGNQCQKCGTTENLHAHHIIPWKKDESKRFEIENGITYCRSCHKKIEGCIPAGWNKGLKRKKV